MNRFDTWQLAGLAVVLVLATVFVFAHVSI
jgi:hypothetical protein